MPIVDMPIEQLRKYTGSSPRPQDFDTYWARALQELDKLDPQEEFVPASFQTPSVACFDLYFTGVGGARVHAKFLRPRKAGEGRPAIVQFHGYSANCGDWQSKLGYVQEGFVLAALDCRGQGGLSQDCVPVRGNTHNGLIIRGLDDPDPDKLYFRNVFLDTVELARIVMAQNDVDAARVGVMGGSQGGALTLACAALEPRINRAAPSVPFLCDYKRVWDMDLDQRAYAELRTYFRYFDPRHEREQAVFEKLGYIDVANLAPRIRGKVLLGTGLMDEVCPPSTQFAAYNRMSCEKEQLIYPDFGHENLPGFDDRTFQFMLEM